MKKNIGKIDRIIRVVIAIIIFLLGAMNQSWFGLIGLIPLFTAIIRWCPLYCPLKISTCGKNEECTLN